VVGFRPTMKFIKNKCAPPFTTAEYEICLGTPERPVFGLDEVASLIEVGSDLGIITKKSSYFDFEDQRLGNGLAAASMMIRTNQALEAKLREKIYGSLLQAAIPTTSEEEPADGDSEDELADDILDERDGD
jgi:recombination protein RecA